MRGVANTGTDPERMAMAVSSSVTVMRARPFRPTTALTGAHAMPPARDSANPRLGRVPLVIESDVLERVLATAVKTGGDFAEVYAEDKRSTSAGLDDGRVEQV